jgi:3-hydroxyisobutyrate dehydrogenase-like beta-hydroxyacid dehydrogenase
MNAVGVLHPGEMGSVAALTLQNAGHRVYWVAEGRSAHSRRRAEELGLCDAGPVAHLCEICSAIVSVCPPEFADDVADGVLQCGFRGLYIDANAISPERAERMAQRMREAGAEFVDASIIGLATRALGRVWIYFSGPQAGRAAELFGTAGPMQPEAIGERIGQASALKMCYAGFSKGSRALLCAVVAAAEQLGVRDLLKRQWARSDRELNEAEKTISRVATKAWRFAPEMHEIASAFEASGIGGDFHRAAAKLYAELAPFKDAESPDIDEILRACASLEKMPRQERTA